LDLFSTLKKTGKKKKRKKVKKGKMVGEKRARFSGKVPRRTEYGAPRVRYSTVAKFTVH
jgi:hypothetical protein